MSSNIITKALCAVAAIAATSTGFAASAAQEAEHLTVEGQRVTYPYKLVVYSDLNLNNEKGVDRLQRRVNQASKSLCKSAGRQPLEQMAAENRCYREAITFAAPQVAVAIKNFSSNEMASLKPIQVASRK